MPFSPLWGFGFAKTGTNLFYPLKSGGPSPILPCCLFGETPCCPLASFPFLSTADGGSVWCNLEVSGGYKTSSRALSTCVTLPQATTYPEGPWYLLRMAFGFWGVKRGLSTSLEGTWTLWDILRHAMPICTHVCARIKKCAL